jgi:hypothetical protein
VGIPADRWSPAETLSTVTLIRDMHSTSHQPIIESISESQKNRVNWPRFTRRPRVLMLQHNRPVKIITFLIEPESLRGHTKETRRHHLMRKKRVKRRRINIRFNDRKVRMLIVMYWNSNTHTENSITPDRIKSSDQATAKRMINMDSLAGILKQPKRHWGSETITTAEAISWPHTGRPTPNHKLTIAITDKTQTFRTSNPHHSQKRHQLTFKMQRHISTVISISKIRDGEHRNRITRNQRGRV